MSRILLARAGWGAAALAFVSASFLYGWHRAGGIAEQTLTCRSRECGLAALQIGVSRLGVQPSLKSLQAAFERTARSGVTFAQLKDAAADNGVQAVTRRLSYVDIKKHVGTAILFVDGGHFLVVDPRETPPAGAVAPRKGTLLKL